MGVISNEKNKQVFFSSLNCGDVFLFEGIYLLVIEEVEDSGNPFNAVSLLDGEPFFIDGDDKVQPFKATLMVESY